MSFFKKILFKNKIIPTETKSANNEGWSTVGYGCSYMSPNGDTSPIELIRHNKNFVYACNQKISQYLASIPLHLYTSTNNSKALIIDHKSLKPYQSKFIKKTVKKSLNNEVIELEDHPVLKLLNKPASNMSYNAWISIIQSYLSLMGNALVEIVREGSEVVALEPLMWESIQPSVNGTTGKIEWYMYTPSNSVPRKLYPDNVIHFTNLSPGSTIIGQGNLEACMNSANLFEWYDNYAMSLARNYGMPGVNINCKANIANKEEAERLARDFIAKFGRSGNGKPIVTFGENVDIKPLTVPPKDMEYQQGRDWAKKVICACFGVPEDLVDTSNSNRASSITAINQFLNITIFPILSKVLEELNTKVVNVYDDSLFIWWDEQEVLADDPQLQAQVLNSYINSKVLTVDEVRAVLGYEPIEQMESIESIDNEGDMSEEQDTSK